MNIWIIIGPVLVFLLLIGVIFMFMSHKKQELPPGVGHVMAYGGHVSYVDEHTGGNEDILGGASTANLVLLKKDSGKEYKVLIGQLKEHGNRLQLPGGFVSGEEDMEKTALRGASEMTGEDYMTEYYGKGIAKTSLFKDTPETKRANVIIVMSKEPKLNKYEQNEELDPSFTKDSSRTKWIPTKDIIDNSSIKSDNGDCITVPFYLKRTISETIKSLK